MRTSEYTILVPSHSDVKTPASCIILFFNSLTLCLCKRSNKEGEKASSLLPRCAIVSGYFIHNNENNDIITATIPPNIVVRKSSSLNSESHNSLTNPHSTETFVPIIEYGITLDILPIKHHIKVTDNAIVAPAKKCVILSIPAFSVIFRNKVLHMLNVL